MLDETVISTASRAIAQAITAGELDAAALNPFLNTDAQRRTILETLQRLQGNGQLKAVTQYDLEPLASRLAGLGPLDPLVQDESVVSIQVLDFDCVLAYRGSVWEETKAHWDNPDHLYHFAKTLADRTGSGLDADHPVVQANFSSPPGRIQIDGTARNAAGVTLHIRMGRRNVITLEQMLAGGGMSGAMFDFVAEIALRDIGVLIVGLPGTGKTTFLEACMDRWPLVPSIGLDDRSEFYPRHPLCTLYNVSPEALAGAFVYALRKNVTRVAVAEVRGDEAAEMLRYSGALTVWTTLHGNVSNAVLRLMALAQGASNSPYANLPETTVRRIIAAAFPVVIEMEKFTIGGRAHYFISEIAQLDKDGQAETVFAAKLDGPRLEGFVEKKQAQAVLKLYRRRMWGSAGLPGLATIEALFKKAPGVAFAALGEILRVNPGNEKAVALLRTMSRSDRVNAWISNAASGYETRIAALKTARDWEGLLGLYSQIGTDPVLSLVGRGALFDGLSTSELARRVTAQRAVADLLAMEADARNVTALVKQVEMVRQEPEVYPPDTGKQLIERLQALATSDSNAPVHFYGLQGDH